MTDFVRLIAPAHATRPMLTSPFRHVSDGGRVRTRSVPRIGWSWEERYAGMDTTSPTVARFLALIDRHWESGELVDVVHPDLKVLLGAGGGTPLVNGASQTGSSLVTDGWPNSTTVLRAGDIIRVGGLPFVVMVTADALTNGSGQVTLSIVPPIPAGSSPANDAAIVVNATDGDVKFACVLDRYDPPVMGPTGIGVGLVLGWREAG